MWRAVAKSRKAALLLAAAAVLLLWALASPLRTPPEDVEVSATSTLAPVLDLTFRDIEGNDVPLSAYRGSLTLVNFWATWCSPCKEELPILDAFYRQHKAEGFTLLAVNVSDRPEEALKFMQEKGYDFPLVYDPPGDTMIELKIRGLPASLLVSREGHLLEYWIGPLSQEMLDAEVLPYLASD